MNAETLLIELLCEELPPRRLAQLGRTFADQLYSQLVNARLTTDESRGYQHYASPRRLAVSIPGIRPFQDDQPQERKGPSLKAGLDPQKNPTAALTGFARSCGVSVDQLEQGVDPKGQPCFVHRFVQKGEPLERVLEAQFSAVLSALPVAKSMRWGASETLFVRPVHGLVALHGTRIVPFEALGCVAGRTTQGHRFLAPGPLLIDHADRYAQRLHDPGSVIASFDERRERIAAELTRVATPDRVLGDPALLDEVTALVEWPVIYRAEFDPAFLMVPQECLILSMQQHQKYFPLGDAQGRLLPRFLLVSNLVTPDPRAIIGGNERVLRARLADARFFFDQDRKHSLESRVARLDHVVYHHRLGSVGDRIRRLERLAESIAFQLDLDPTLARRTAHLMKADLVTDMVGEFPELQGTMGCHYARHDAQPEALARAIEAHYRPRFAQDGLPDSRLGGCVALADKLETLLGIFAIGEAPTGDRDPFGLRRAALGVIRILIETPLPLDLHVLIDEAAAVFAPPLTAESLPKAEVRQFVLDRLRGYLRERNHASDVIDSVLAVESRHIARIPARLDALARFMERPQAMTLAQANKRIRNLLRKSAPDQQPESLGVQKDRLTENAEQVLFERLVNLEPVVLQHLARQDDGAALDSLGELAEPVERFFTDVMVMCEDPGIRNNRLALLGRLERCFGQVADLSRLES